MKSYTQLSQEERYFISTNLARKRSVPSIAKELDRPPSTVYRELERNRRPTGLYAASVAHSYATARRRRSRRGPHLPSELIRYIMELLAKRWSPEQISNYLIRKSLQSVSFQSIYRWIRKDRRRGGSLYKALRIMPKQRRKRYGSVDSRGVLQGKRNISERPDLINTRLEFGHWEGDTVMGKDRHQCILTLVERKTGITRMAKLSNRSAANTTKAIIASIKQEPLLFKTITFDNGTEFHSYKVIEEGTGVICYFANPHHPWERGCNENLNGLLRQYIPKGKKLDYIGNTKIQKICDDLNTRPRKRLNYFSPKESCDALF
jgi:transposase, IS30 family